MLTAVDVMFDRVAPVAPDDRRPNGRLLKQFTVINYGRHDATCDVSGDVDDDDDDVIAARRSATHARPAALRVSSPHRPAAPERGPRWPPPPAAVTVEDEVRRCRQQVPARRAVGRHYSGGHCTAAAPPPPPPPLAVLTTTTVARRRHRSDGVFLDLPVEPAVERATGDAEPAVPATTAADRKSASDDERRSSASPSADDSFRRTVDDARLPEVARRGRLFAKCHRRRLVLQSGVCNVSFANVDRRGARLLMDIFTTLLEMKWR